MFGGNPFRSQNAESRTQALRNMPTTNTSQSSSLASSFQSSAVTSLVPAAPSPSCFSQSDIFRSDHSSSRPVSNSSPKTCFSPLPIAPVPRTSSLAHMGQSFSRSDTASSVFSTPSSPPPLPLPAGASSRLRRAWVGRRKKSEDISAVLSTPPHSSDQYKAPEGQGLDTSNPSVASVDSFEVPTPSYERPTSRAKLFLQSSLGIWKQKGIQQHTKSPKLGGTPPVPPPKPVELQSIKKSTVTSSQPLALPEESSLPIITSPGISAAIQFINSQDDAKTDKLDIPSRIVGKPDAETKQDWRKSDSTMVSYATVRPGALAGNRSPRPVSLAESSHSGHTIVPVNKRLSALIADPDFGLAEETDSDSEREHSRIVTSGRPSPAASIKTRNRRSASLHHSPAFGMRSTAPAIEALKPFVSESSVPPARMSADQLRTPASGSQDTPTLTRAAANGIIASTMAPGAVHSTGSSIRGRLAAWTAASSSERQPPPPQHPRRVNPAANPTFRQTAVSMTGGFAPVAIGLGKRAAEKVHRVWGGLSSSASNYSAYSSTTSLSSATPSTTSGRYPDAVDRSASGQSIGNQSSCGGGWMRRTPNAPSGSWSVNSSLTSSSTSDTDAFAMPAGPSLGTRLRGPRKNGAGAAVIGGLVFGRSLQQCVKDTATDRVKQVYDIATSAAQWSVKPLEERALPALVLRCAQHINRWGLEEEGLFRISGRPSHVAKLRSEFDTGSDYDLAQCGPGDLDPHAVASIFKAYLRELPGSLLTNALSPRFEAALATQSDSQDANFTTFVNGSWSPSANPSPVLRKPPSLSTLAMPSFAGMRAISEAARLKLAGLIAQLPPENKELLYTVVELIQATAAHSKETKMPLGNLFLVLCPSLSMSPPLLRVLCEVKSIWDAPPPSGKTSDIIDISAPVSSQTTVLSPGIPNSEPGVILLDDTDSDSDLSDLPAARPRNGTRRRPMPGMLQVPGLSRISPYRSSGGSSGQEDAASYVSALDRTFSSPSSMANDSSHNLPALSNSTDSLATPSTVSEVSSFQSPANVLADNASREKLEPIITTLPLIASSADPPLPGSIRKPAISSPIPFPGTGSSPRTPSSPRKSLALTSFPPFGRSEPNTPQTGSHTWTHRSKRPSLTLLFSKKSSSSLNCSMPSTKPDPGYSVTKDVSRHPTCSAPFASRTHLTISSPILDTAISSSPVFASMKKEATATSAVHAPSIPSAGADEDTRERKDSSASSLFSTPQSTPIADFYRMRSASSLSLAVGVDTSRPSPSKLGIHSSPSKSSLTPSIDIGLESTAEDNWAQSVLLEAQAKSGAARSRWSVKEAIKRFEGRS